MDAKKKRLAFLFGGILVAIIFLSSYAAFSNNGSPTTATTTAKAAGTVFVTGYTNAIITNYSDVAYVSFSNSSNSVKNTVTNSLSMLQANGTVVDSIVTNNTYQVVLSGISPYTLQQFLYQKTNSTNSISVGSTADVQLPQTIAFTYTNVPIDLHLTNRNYTVYLSQVQSIGSTINVSISTLLYTNNESIYDNQFRVSYNPTVPTVTAASTTSIARNTISSNSPSSKNNSNSTSNSQTSNSVSNSVTTNSPPNNS